MRKSALVLTTINAPNAILRALSDGAAAHDIPFVIAGDTKSPDDFSLPHGVFLSIAEQDRRFPRLSRLTPHRHYARKNIAYLVAVELGVETIQETDDDNFPLDAFWSDPAPDGFDILGCDTSWLNVYALFSNESIWPRGFPLEHLQTKTVVQPRALKVDRPLIRQGLANDNPDVDAVYRLTRSLPVTFNSRRPVMLAPGVWCPFNSQNTSFERSVFVLMYLPSHCSFRMTDIWRSFVAQRCLWELGQGVLFHEATVYQERNEHSLLRDFEDEIPGYLSNDKIRKILEDTSLDKSDMAGNLVRCYESLIKQAIIPEQELNIVREWVSQCERLLAHCGQRPANRP